MGTLMDLYSEQLFGDYAVLLLEMLIWVPRGNNGKPLCGVKIVLHFVFVRLQVFSTGFVNSTPSYNVVSGVLRFWT